MALRGLDDREGRRVPTAALVALLAIAVVVGWKACARDRAIVAAPPPEIDLGADAGIAPTASVEVPPPPPRCADLSTTPFNVGEPPPKAPADADAGDDDDDEPAHVPYAAEVGRATTFGGGFAVGALRAGEGGTVAVVATVGLDGAGGAEVKLARSRGDFEPPIVFGLGDAVLAAMLEPNASGRALKLARIERGEVSWGSELSEGRDDSLAVDLVAAGAHGLVAWDDLSADGKLSRVVLASFDPATMRAQAARPVSGAKEDAESPRLVPRPGGFWLAYVVRGSEAKPPDAGVKKKDPAEEEEDDEESEGEGERSGEAIPHAWIEVVPLDEGGGPAGAARRATPADGTVLSYDVDAGDDGALLLAWRDDDTPTGSSGGTVSTTVVRLGGIAEPSVLLAEGVGPGVPELLHGWIAVSSLTGARRFGALDAQAHVVGAFVAEPSLGGEPIAASGDRLLVTRPAGSAMRLTISRCVAAQAAPDAGAP